MDKFIYRDAHSVPRFGGVGGGIDLVTSERSSTGDPKVGKLVKKEVFLYFCTNYNVFMSNLPKIFVKFTLNQAKHFAACPLITRVNSP